MVIDEYRKNVPVDELVVVVDRGLVGWCWECDNTSKQIYTPTPTKLSATILAIIYPERSYIYLRHTDSIIRDMNYKYHRVAKFMPRFDGPYLVTDTHAEASTITLEFHLPQTFSLLSTLPLSSLSDKTTIVNSPHAHLTSLARFKLTANMEKMLEKTVG